jgi:hypothetical protein
MIFRKTGPHFSGSCSWTGVSPVPVFRLYERRGELRGRNAASLLPHSASKTRVNALMGEKDRLRGFGRRSFFSNFRTPSAHPSPLWGEGVAGVAIVRNDERCGAPAYSYKSRGMHCRAARSGAPILRGVVSRMSCRARHCSGCDTQSSARRRQPAASPPQRRPLRHALRVQARHKANASQ